MTATTDAAEIPWVRRFDRGALADAVAEQIEQSILTGELKNGARLPPEEAMSRAMGVSRSVMREALVHLRARGLVETVNGRGTFVSHRQTTMLADALLRQLQASGGTIEALIKLFEARTAIEIQAAADACVHATDDDLEEIRGHLAAMRDSRDDPAAYAAADMAFHLAVVDAAHNPFLSTLLAPLIHVIEAGVIETQFSGDAVDAGIRGHGRIHRAIAARNAERAREAMSRHLQESLTKLRQQRADAVAAGAG